MKPTAAYYRVSSDEQDSIDAQYLVLRPWMEERGFQDVKEFPDDGKPGGTIHKRPHFSQLIERLENGEFKALCTFHPDRLGRFEDMADAVRVVNALKNNHVHLHYYDGDDEGHYDPSNELQMVDLMIKLLHARVRNYEQGKKIKAGHKRARLQQGFSGGKTPYGIRYVKYDRETRKEKKKPGHFEIVPAEHETLRVIIDKVRAGWGIHKIADLFNANPEQFPKRVRKYRGKPVTKWSDTLLRQILHSDFYHTGVIEPVQKGGIPVDTGIRLFEQDTFEAARREMQVRRNKSFVQEGQLAFPPPLLVGLAMCGHCGWKLGRQRMVRKDRFENPIIYFYYRCKGASKPEKECSFSQTPSHKLDTKVWEKFSSSITDPTEMQTLILDQQFAYDKDHEELLALVGKSEADLESLNTEREKILYQHRREHITDEEYEREMERTVAESTKAKEDYERYRSQARLPDEVKEAVRYATEHLAFEMKYLWAMEKIAEAREAAKDADIITQFKVLDGADKIVEKLTAEIDGLLAEDVDRKQLAERLRQQKRAILQDHIDPERGIQVKGLDDVEINLFVSRLDLFYNFRNEE